jgi:hypothetical protein
MKWEGCSMREVSKGKTTKKKRLTETQAGVVGGVDEGW